MSTYREWIDSRGTFTGTDSFKRLGDARAFATNERIFGRAK